MPNSIAHAQNYLPLLDEVYKRSALTSILDTPNVNFLHADTIQVFKTSMDGLGNYSRENGFAKGSVTGTWEAMKLTQDRGRSFVVDNMDNEESIDLAFGTLAGEFLRTRVVPELDSYRFAQMAGKPGILKATPADFGASAHDVAGAIAEAEEKMNNAEVPVEGRILFISENAYKWLKKDVVREYTNEGDLRSAIDTYDGMRVIRVPSSRFSTQITLKTGDHGQTEGGYVQTAATGYPINFMIVHPSAVVSVVKHTMPRIFSPDVYQDADAWKFDYRVYHDLFVYDNKANGIYLHNAATANE